MLVFSLICFPMHYCKGAMPEQKKSIPVHIQAGFGKQRIRQVLSCSAVKPLTTPRPSVTSKGHLPVIIWQLKSPWTVLIPILPYPHSNCLIITLPMQHYKLWVLFVKAYWQPHCNTSAQKCFFTKAAGKLVIIQGTAQVLTVQVQLPLLQFSSCDPWDENARYWIHCKI